LRSDAAVFVERLTEYDDADARARPAPDMWSPLEYACHVRDVLRVQTERVAQAQREDEPTFTPMRRDERVLEDRYNEQDPKTVGNEIIDATDAFVALLASLDDEGWSRTGIYNYPAPASRTVEWIATHTSHELLHHRRDIARA
jgi:S-DNA-T family DNA segregation ATPase FtsK/SpoIIIE